MSEKTEMMADMIKNLAALLTEQNSEMTMEEALTTVFNSETYVFAFLKEELTEGKFE